MTQPRICIAFVVVYESFYDVYVHHVLKRILCCCPLLQWHINTSSKELFPELLNKLLVKMEVKDAENMKSGFRKSGIYPLDKNQVLARLPKSVDGAAEAVSASFIEHLVQMRGEDKDAPRRKRLKVSVVLGRSISADDVADLLESNKKKSTKKAVKTSSTSTGAETGNGDNPEHIASADTGSRTDSDDINPQTSDAGLLAQIHEDETTADVEPDDDDDDDEHSFCPDSLSSSVVSENSLDIPSNDIPVCWCCLDRGPGSFDVEDATTLSWSSAAVSE